MACLARRRPSDPQRPRLRPAARHLRHRVQDEVLDANPCRIRAAMQTKRRRDVDILTPTEVNLLASKMPPNLRASVLLAAWCGWRWGETSELRRADVSRDVAVLRVHRAVTYRRGDFIVGRPRRPRVCVTCRSRRTSAQY